MVTLRTFSGDNHGSIAKRALLASLATFAVLCSYRTYDLWSTGFVVSDEHGYISNAMSSSLAGAVYGDRYFYGYLNNLLFHLLGVTNMDSVMLLLPFYLFFWGGSTFVAFYYLMKTLDLDDRVIAISLFSSFFLVGFLLLSLGFLTEPVGLALALWGILLLVKFAKAHGAGFRILLYALFSSLLFAAARYTREPYGALLLGCIPVILLIGFSQMRGARPRHQLLVALSLALFIGPSFYLSVYPSSILGAGNQPVSQFVGSLTTPVIAQTRTQNVTTTATSTVTSIATSTTVKTVVTTSNGQTNTVIETQTFTSTLSNTITSVGVTTQTISSFVLNNRLGNSLWIFIAGIALAWNPILMAAGGIGFVLLLRRSKGMDITCLTVILAAMLSLASYLVVSYILSPDPSYLTFQHYSTILRFSDTSLPAYFLLAPFAYSALARRKRYPVLLGVFLVIFALVTIPAYEVYASSNLDLQANPFSLGYRTPMVMIRDYILSHPSNAPFYIMGLSNATFGDWWFTPGNTYLKGVYLYPYLNESRFLIQSWSVFYVFGSSTNQIDASLTYIYGNSSSSAPGPESLPFGIVQIVPIYQTNGFVFERIQLYRR